MIVRILLLLFLSLSWLSGRATASETNPLVILGKCKECGGELEARGWMFGPGLNDQGDPDPHALGWWLFISNCCNTTNCGTANSSDRMRATITYAEYMALSRLRPRPDFKGLGPNSCTAEQLAQWRAQGVLPQPKALPFQALRPPATHRAWAGVPGLQVGRPFAGANCYWVPDGGGQVCVPTNPEQLEQVTKISAGMMVGFLGGVWLVESVVYVAPLLTQLPNGYRWAQAAAAGSSVWVLLRPQTAAANRPTLPPLALPPQPSATHPFGLPGPQGPVDFGKLLRQGAGAPPPPFPLVPAKPGLQFPR